MLKKLKEKEKKIEDYKINKRIKEDPDRFKTKGKNEKKRKQLFRTLIKKHGSLKKAEEAYKRGDEPSYAKFTRMNERQKRRKYGEGYEYRQEKIKKIPEKQRKKAKQKYKNKKIKDGINTLLNIDPLSRKITGKIKSTFLKKKKNKKKNNKK